MYGIGLKNSKQKGFTNKSNSKRTNLASAVDTRRRSRCPAVFAAFDAARSTSSVCILAQKINQEG